MAIISGSTAQFLLFTVLPFLWPRIAAFYRSVRHSGSVVRPLSRGASLTLNLVLATALAFLLTTLPLFSPANIFLVTDSRIQAPTGVLFNRLSSLRPLTPPDERLRAAFEKGGLEARLFYAKYGPDALQGCGFVDHKSADAEGILFAYALPAMLAPHLAHLAVLGLATARGEGARWRSAAVMVAVACAVAEIGYVWSYERQGNSMAARPGEVDWFHWRVRVIRGLVLAATDGILGWMMWLASTGRAFVVPVSGAEKVEGMTRQAEEMLIALRGLGTLRNVAYRNPGMRNNIDRYWVQEGEIMRGVIEDRDVVQAMTSVLENTNMEQLEREAGQHVEAMLPPVDMTEQQ